MSDDAAESGRFSHLRFEVYPGTAHDDAEFLKAVSLMVKRTREKTGVQAVIITVRPAAGAA